MSDDFNYKCTRRSGGRRISPTIEESVLAGEENFGAGSGGEWYDGGHDHHYDGAYQLSSPEILFLAGGPGALGKNDIVLKASNSDSFTNATVEVHGDSHVRITTGGPDIMFSDVDRLEGVRVLVEPNQVIGLLHGPKDGDFSSVLLQQPSNEDETSIEILSNEGGIWIESTTKITLSVGGGTSSITLEPDHIVIKGPMVFIN